MVNIEIAQLLVTLSKVGVFFEKEETNLEK